MGVTPCQFDSSTFFESRQANSPHVKVVKRFQVLLDALFLPGAEDAKSPLNRVGFSYLSDIPIRKPMWWGSGTVGVLART
jgi:hypothetical protein